MYQYKIDGPQNRKRNGQKKKCIPIKGENNSILLILKSKLKNCKCHFSSMDSVQNWQRIDEEGTAVCCSAASVNGHSPFTEQFSDQYRENVHSLGLGHSPSKNVSLENKLRCI